VGLTLAPGVRLSKLIKVPLSAGVGPVGVARTLLPGVPVTRVGAALAETAARMTELSSKDLTFTLQ
jgi:hypothetical protein